MVGSVHRRSCSVRAPSPQFLVCCRQSRFYTSAAQAAAIEQRTSDDWLFGSRKSHKTPMPTGCGGQRSLYPLPDIWRLPSSTKKSRQTRPGGVLQELLCCRSFGNRGCFLHAAHRRKSWTVRGSAQSSPRALRRKLPKPKRRAHISQRIAILAFPISAAWTRTLSECFLRYLVKRSLPRRTPTSRWSDRPATARSQ